MDGKTFTFEKLPNSLAELKAMPEISMDSPEKTAALAIAVLCNFKNSFDETIAMLDLLKGPEPTNPFQKQFIRERLSGKEYKTFSFFKGATPENNYTPDKPYVITVNANPYPDEEENWTSVYVKSSGADAERPIKLRKKPSTGQWFINDLLCLSDIKIPAAEDPWA